MTVYKWIFFEAPFMYINAASIVLFYEMVHLASVLRERKEMNQEEADLVEYAESRRVSVCVSERNTLKGSFAALAGYQPENFISPKMNRAFERNNDEVEDLSYFRNLP